MALVETIHHRDAANPVWHRHCVWNFCILSSNRISQSLDGHWSHTATVLLLDVLQVLPTSLHERETTERATSYKIEKQLNQRSQHLKLIFEIAFYFIFFV